MMALKMLLVKVALSDMGFVLGVTEATVLAWLGSAAQKAHESNTHRLRDLPVTAVQLDAMWSFIRRKPAQQADADRASPELSADGRQWVWSSFAPEFSRILVAFVGPRTFEECLAPHADDGCRGLGCARSFAVMGSVAYLLALIECLPDPQDLAAYRQARTSHTTDQGAPSSFGLGTGGQKEAPRASASVGVSGVLWC